MVFTDGCAQGRQETAHAPKEYCSFWQGCADCTVPQWDAWKEEMKHETEEARDTTETLSHKASKR